MSQRLIALLLLLAVVITNASAANPPRFVARFVGGAFVEGNALAEWHSLEATPKLESQLLFDPANPLRWLIDRSQTPSPQLPESFVEMTTGDRLPGTVVDFRTGEDSLYAVVPPHFVVRYDGPTGSSLDKQSTILRIDARYVRRIVWARRPDDSVRPRTAYLRDASFMSFRSVRFSAGTVSLLLESGPRRLSMNELAEIDLATSDFWSVYMDEMATLSPDAQRRLLQSETAEGLIITTSLDRMIPRSIGDARDINRWVLGVQPAWSLDLFWLWQGTVRARRCFAPHEIPLTRVTPVRVEQRSSFGGSTSSAATNRNAQGGPLRAANREAGWGFGVQAFSELEFDFPAAVRSLRSDFAIDAEMKNGGCVQARVINVSAGSAAIYQGPVVVGSESVLDTGAMGISGSGESLRKVILQVDPVMTNRPPNADPFDIRDQANWLDPIVELDANLVKLQIESRGPKQNLAWRGWTVAPESGGQLQHANFFAEAPGNGGAFRTSAIVTGNALKLTMSRTLTDDDQWFVVDAVRTQPPGPPCKLSVKVGNGMPFEWDLPVYDKGRSDFRPLIVPLAEIRKTNPSGNVELEIRAQPTPERVPVLWRAIRIVDQHPMFYRLLEDSLPIGSTNPNGVAITTNGELDDQQKFTGLRSLRVPVSSDFRISLPRPISVRERPQLGEYRFLRFAIRKQGGGGMRIAVHHATSAEQPANYEAGVNPPRIRRSRELPTRHCQRIGNFSLVTCTAISGILM